METKYVYIIQLQTFTIWSHRGTNIHINHFSDDKYILEIYWIFSIDYSPFLNKFPQRLGSKKPFVRISLTASVD